MVNKLSMGSSALAAGRQLTALLVSIYKPLTKVTLDTQMSHCTEKAIKDIHSDYWKALAISLVTAGGVIKLDRHTPADYSR